MEAKALSLIGHKMKAAQLLFGDEVGGAYVPEDEFDFLTQLAMEVLNGTKLADLHTLFADEMQLSSSQLGSPTEISPLMVPILPASQTWDEWLRQHSMGGMKHESGRMKKFGNRASTGQLSIWGKE